jgi:hypothetical protein
MHIRDRAESRIGDGGKHAPIDLAATASKDRIVVEPDFDTIVRVLCTCQPCEYGWETERCLAAVAKTLFYTPA